MRSAPRSSDKRGHCCVLFDVPSLLYDQCWLGADSVRVELVNHAVEPTMNARSAFLRACDQTGMVADVDVVGTTGALVVSSIKFEKKVDPNPLLELVELCLWVEPNKARLPPVACRPLQRHPACHPHCANRAHACCTIRHGVCVFGVVAFGAVAAQDGSLTRARCRRPQVDKLHAEDLRVVVTDAAEFPTRLGEEINKCLADQRQVLQHLKNTQRTSGGGTMAAQSKGGEVFRRIERLRQSLQALLTTAPGSIAQIELCSVCQRILCVLSRRRAVAGTKPAADDLPSRIAACEAALRAATGPDNKQKRKRLHKKLKDLKDAQDAQQGGGSAAAPGAGSRPA
jgi:hypothetical protein